MSSPPDFSDRYAALGRGDLPDPPTPLVNPATPTAAMVVDGISLAPEARLAALAAVRDRHRSAARAANDQMHGARLAAEDARRRAREGLERHGRNEPQAVRQAEELEGQAREWDKCRAVAQAEAEVAADAWRTAEGTLKAAIEFARDHGAALPVAFSGSN